MSLWRPGCYSLIRWEHCHRRARPRAPRRERQQAPPHSTTTTGSIQNIVPAEFTQLGQDATAKIDAIFGDVQGFLSDRFTADKNSLAELFAQVQQDSTSQFSSMLPLMTNFTGIDLSAEFDFDHVQGHFDTNFGQVFVDVEPPVIGFDGSLVPQTSMTSFGTTSISGLTELGNFTIDFINGYRSVDATFTRDLPLSPGMTVNRINAHVTWASALDESLTITAVREVRGTDGYRVFNVVYTQQPFQPTVIDADISFQDGSTGGSVLIHTIDGQIDRAASNVHIHQPNFTLNAGVDYMLGITRLYGNVDAFYEGDGYTAGATLGFYKDPWVFDAGAGLFVHRSEAEYLALKYKFHDPYDLPATSSVAALLAVPVIPNQVYGYGEFNYTTGGGLSIPNWQAGLMQTPFGRTGLEVRLWAQPERDGSGTAFSSLQLTR